jgi:hypothetical protein
MEKTDSYNQQTNIRTTDVNNEIKRIDTSNVLSSIPVTNDVIKSSDNNNTNANANANANAVNLIEFSLEDIFVNLTLIARIEVGNKLYRADKYVNIDTSYFQFLSRWFSGQNRSDSIKFTAIILSKAFEISDTLTKQKDDESRQNLLRLNTALSNSINGLSNLSQTYHYDKLAQSEIDVMINNIRTKLNIQSKHIQFVDYVSDKKDEPRFQREITHDKQESRKDNNTILENIKKNDKRDKDTHPVRDVHSNHVRDNEEHHHSGHVKKKSL